MTLEVIVFSVNGRTLPHKSATLEQSAEEAVRTALFDVAWTGAGIPCAPDDEATITVSGEVWGTGYVRDVRGAHDTDARSYSVSFVSRTCDATECSIDHPTGLKRDADLGDIAKEFDVLGVGVEVKARTIKKSVHKVRPGETLFDTLETDARAQGVLIHDNPEGKLVLADKPEGRHAGALKRGLNIESASGSLSGATSFSSVKVRGQASIGVNASALRPEGEAKGTSRRRRPLIVPFEGEATSERLKTRAKWESRRASGEGVACQVVVPGFRDEGGNLWKANWLVEVDDDWLGINQDMVIASVTLSQDGSDGTVARLSLKDPRALGGDNPRGSSNAAWGAPSAVSAEYREG
ncbi:hypothetical protein [Hoeflea sp. BAL378]|uniref:phage baseplate assembly protein n=1 Tax=Hoeflea sp. BAL378 TaxID=1547437 RepID=UPI0006903165|nr:hypothetical protein [Hoeflea sp. BAL378]